MQPVSAAPAHLLLSRKDEVDTHSTRKAQTVAAAAFSSYAFGPADMADGKAPKKDVKAAQNATALHNPLSAHSAATVTALQSVDDLAATAGFRQKP